MSNNDPVLDLTPSQWRAIDERRKTAWIGADITVKGTVICSRDLSVDGQIDGAIDVGDHTVTVGAGARIKADLVVKAIRVSGAITGNVTARDLVDVRETGSIDGDVKAPRFSLVEGGQVRGRVDTT